MNERWSPIGEYEGMYEVSDLGRVRSLPRVLQRRNGTSCTVQGRVLTPARNAKGYAVVNLRSLGSGRTFLVHKLVLGAFVGPPPDGTETRHLNGDAADNNLANLTYGTPAENARDKVNHGTYWRTHCRKGHEFSGDNLVVNAYQRKCRKCSDDYQREYNRTRRGSRSAA